MKKIASFTIDHTILPKGMYISRVDDDIVTYDIRMRRPNVDEVLSNKSIHTIEHLFATFVRNTDFEKNIVYFGPMGCRTGFYFLTRGISDKDAISLTQKAFEFIKTYSGEIPGVSAKECGNFREHNLEAAVNDSKDMCEAIKNWTEDKLTYPEN